MSRSYKKTPWCGDKKGKSKKRIANRTVRQYLKNHRAWERYYWRCSMFPNAEHKEPNKEEEYIQWRKYYYYK